MSDSLSDETIDRIRAALFAGRKIEAIKLYREATGADLRDAKDTVEGIERELRAQTPDLFTAPPGKGCGLLVLSLGLLVAVGGWSVL